DYHACDKQQANDDEEFPLSAAHRLSPVRSHRLAPDQLGARCAHFLQLSCASNRYCVDSFCMAFSSALNSASLWAFVVAFGTGSTAFAGLFTFALGGIAVDSACHA